MSEHTTKRGSKSEEKSVSASGVDLTPIRKYLAMSPTEWVRAWRSAARHGWRWSCGSMLPDLQTILEALVGQGVEFVVIGGMAAVAQGAPITIFDLDIC